MSAKAKILSIKSKCKDKIESKNTNHRLVNICFVAFFSLIILFSMVGGVNVDVGSTVRGDGDSVIVRQNYFQIMRAAANGIFMSDEQAVNHVRQINQILENEFFVLGLSPDIRTAGNYTATGDRDGNAYPAVSSIGEVARVVQDIIDRGGNPNSINWVLYRYAFARAVMYLYTEDTLISDPEWDHFRASWPGNLAVAMAGQAILRAAISTMALAVALVMLAFSILALIKKKEFSKTKLAFVLLTVAAFMQIVFRFNFMRLNWAWIIVLVITFIMLAAFILYKHIMLDERDFSMTMFIHNAALLGGGILSFILLTGPLFRVITAEYNETFYGINLLYDLTVAQTAYISVVPMSYVLTLVVVMVILGLPFVMNIIFLMVNLIKFIKADYTHNERRIMLSIFVAVNIIVLLIFGIANIGIVDLYLNVVPLWAIFVIQPLVVIGMLVFEIIYKVKPVRKELVIN
ncbi:MAG: hypothetical protein FWE03_01550 [Firmicutes bacterium]|nr:hypothetical protein [Bacillota bacterium]